MGIQERTGDEDKELICARAQNSTSPDVTHNFQESIYQKLQFILIPHYLIGDSNHSEPTVLQSDKTRVDLDDPSLPFN